MAWTTADLLASVARLSYAPAGQNTLQTPDILAIADEILRTHVVPVMLSVREEFNVIAVDMPIVAGKAAYGIPARAVGMTVREIWLVDGTIITPNFPRYEPEEITTTTPGTPRGFYLQGNQIILHPTPDVSAKSLRVFFPLRPGRHIETSAAGLITAVDTDANIVTVAAVPPAWTTGSQFDLIRQDASQEPRAIDLASTLVNGDEITLPSLPSGLRPGDYVALAGQTPLPFLIEDFQMALAQGVAAQILRSMNQPSAKDAKDDFLEALASAKKLLTPRVQGEARTIMPRNWRGRR